MRLKIKDLFWFVVVLVHYENQPAVNCYSFGAGNPSH